MFFPCSSLLFRVMGGLSINQPISYWGVESKKRIYYNIAVCLELIYSTSGLRLVQILCKSGGRKEEFRGTFRRSFIEMITDKLDCY